MTAKCQAKVTACCVALLQEVGDGRQGFTDPDLMPLATFAAKVNSLTEKQRW
jgi:hypothetical protein